MKINKKLKKIIKKIKNEIQKKKMKKDLKKEAENKNNSKITQPKQNKTAEAKPIVIDNVPAKKKSVSNQNLEKDYKRIEQKNKITGKT